MEKIGQNVKIKKVAITGGLSSGKSSVCRFLKQLGAVVVNADAIVHKLLDSNTEIRSKIVELLGPDVQQNHQISREAIANKVFNHPKKLQQLENILHPEVEKQIHQLYSMTCQTQNASLFVAEVPLLFEAGWENWFDLTCNITSSIEDRKKRFLAQGGCAEDFEKRNKRFLTEEERKRRSDITLENRGSLEELQQYAKTLYKQLTKSVNS